MENFPSNSEMLAVPDVGPVWPWDSARKEDYYRTILDELPAAIYITDAAGRITYYNEAAVALWGHRPSLGESEWCGSWKLFWPDGRILPHGECPMAVAIKEQRPIRGMEAVAERPDGTKVPFIPYPTPLFAEDGTMIGAVNMLVDISHRKQVEELRHHLAAIVECSADAIISKDMNGIITSWNKGAEQLFGYEAEEVIGRPITILIPPERLDEEPAILSRIRSGERIDHYETVRRRKDGSFIDLSLSVSPIRGINGEIVGASKIARNIAERRRAQEQQRLLLREMNHRIKNLFAVSNGLVNLSARSATSVEEFASVIRERLTALARAHALTLSSVDDANPPHRTTVHALIRAILLPFDGDAMNGARIDIRGDDIDVPAGAVTSFALLLHELATNAAKHGALSVASGRIEIDCSIDAGRFVVMWRERGGPQITQAMDGEGFGTRLARATVEGQLGGNILREWNPEGLELHVSVPVERLKSAA